MRKEISLRYKLGALIFIFFSAITSAGFGIYIGKIVDVISKGERSAFLGTLLIIFMIITVNVVSTLGGKWCVYRNAAEKAKALKDALYNREMRQTKSVGVDIANFSSKIDVIFNDDYLSRWLIVDNVLIFIFSAAAIIHINWIMFVVAIVVSVIPMLTPMLFKAYVQKAAKGYADTSSLYLKFLNSTLSGRKEVMRYRVLEQFERRHSGNNETTEASRVQNRFANYSVQVVTEGVGNYAFILVFLVGGLLSFNGYLAIGGVIGVVQLMNNIVRPVIEIASLKSKIGACAPILADLNAPFEEAPVSIQIEASEEEALLKAEGLFFAYEGGGPLIEDFSYDYLKGKKYLIQGESGCGKSTLAKLLVGELAPHKGAVYYTGEAAFEAPDLIRYVEQQAYLFNGTIDENIAFYRGVAEERLTGLKKRLGLDGIDASKHLDDANGLSGGQKSRVNLARATVHLPRVLIVDEPTSALDPANELSIMKFLAELPITVIVVSHACSREITELFDDIITLS